MEGELHLTGSLRTWIVLLVDKDGVYLLAGFKRFFNLSSFPGFVLIKNTGLRVRFFSCKREFHSPHVVDHTTSGTGCEVSQLVTYNSGMSGA